MRTTIKFGLTLVGLGVVAALAYGAAVTYDLNRTIDPPAGAENESGAVTPAQIARGLYVSRAADCAACHTAAAGAPMAGGYALGTPFGKIYSSNITADKATGIGNWTFAQFDRAVRHGQGSHGYLYPAMPYTAYAWMTDSDMRDLWAYIRTVTPVTQKVVENRLPFPYDQRWLMGGWNLLFFHPRPFQADPSKSVEYNRGAYLVEGPGHCAACHTGKNFLGGDSSQFLQGGALDGWYAPDLTPNPHVGLGSWSVADIARYLKTGANEHAVASGPMTEAIEDSTEYLTDADLHAIGTYLQGQKPSGGTPPAPLAAGDASMTLGKRVYESQCIACHVSSGNGIRQMIPSLAGSPVINSGDPATLLQMVLKGGDGPQTETNPTGAGMPRFDWKLSDDEVAAVLTYVRNTWNNAAPAVDSATVQKARSQLGAQAWIGH